ncbi:hypothetical protein SESBI_02237 [Sesbania bispinosa]|nr:hypothetical protein SESBI_02237 [Sesbania bispinosa]
MGVFVVLSKNNPSGNSSSFWCLFCDEIEEDAAETAVLDAGAEFEQRVTRKIGSWVIGLALDLVWGMGEGRMEEENESDIEAMETRQITK